MAIEFPLALIAFDILYAEGKDYTEVAYEQRRRALERLLRPNAYIRLVDRIVTAKAEKLQEFFDQQVEKGLEGIVAKKLDAPYAPGARNFNWVKLKPPTADRSATRLMSSSSAISTGAVCARS